MSLHLSSRLICCSNSADDGVEGVDGDEGGVSATLRRPIVFRRLQNSLDALTFQTISQLFPIANGHSWLYYYDECLSRSQPVE